MAVFSAPKKNLSQIAMKDPDGGGTGKSPKAQDPVTVIPKYEDNVAVVSGSQVSVPYTTPVHVGDTNNLKNAASNVIKGEGIGTITPNNKDYLTSVPSSAPKYKDNLPEVPNAEIGGSSEREGALTVGDTTVPEQVAGATVTGAGNLPGSSWEGTTPIDSYEEYLRKNQTILEGAYNDSVAYYDNRRNSTLKALEEQRKAAEQAAEIERERLVVDARSSYAQNLATHGANAEALGRMGLTGSGYSDYLDSRAYATQRAETQNANAQAQAVKREASYIESTGKIAADNEAEEGKMLAKSTYLSNLMSNDANIAKHRFEEEQKAEAEAKAAAEKVESDAKYATNAYYEFLASANQGAYTVEQAKQLAADYGLSETQTQSLVSAAETYHTNERNAVLGAFRTAIDTYGDEYDVSEITRAEESGEITKPEANDLRGRYNDKVLSDVTAIIKSGNEEAITSALQTVDALHNAGKITTDTYQSSYLAFYKYQVQYALQNNPVSTLPVVFVNVKKAQQQGKLSESGFVTIKKTAGVVGDVINQDATNTRIDYDTWYGRRLVYKMGTEDSFRPLSTEPVNKELSSILEIVASVNGGLKEGVFVDINDKQYVYVKDGDKAPAWYETWYV